MQETQEFQGYSIQEGQGLEAGPGCAPLSLQTVRLRWSDQAYIQEEGQADQEDHPQARVPRDQGQAFATYWKMQDIHSRKGPIEEQVRSPLLSHLTLLVKHPMLVFTADKLQDKLEGDCRVAD